MRSNPLWVEPRRDKLNRIRHLLSQTPVPCETGTSTKYLALRMNNNAHPEPSMYQDTTFQEPVIKQEEPDIKQEEPESFYPEQVLFTSN